MLLVSCRLSATGFRFSVIRSPPRNWASLTVGLPSNRPDPDGVTTFRTHELRPGWVAPKPRGQVVLTRLATDPQPAPAAITSGPSLRPATTSHPARLALTRHQQSFTRFTRPVFPSPVAPGWNGRPRASPELRTPPLLATHVGVGTSHEHEPGTMRPTSADPPIR